MEIEEIKNMILRRLYEEALKGYLEHKLVDLKVLMEERGIERELMIRVDEELNRDGFFLIHAMGMVVAPNVRALIYCEEHGLVDQELVDRQKDIRKRILEVCADHYEEKPSSVGLWGKDIYQRAGITELDFNNSIDILAYLDCVEQIGPFDQWKSTQVGRGLVQELRKRRNRKAEFEKLKAKIGITSQTRGHRLEDLLTEVIADEGWNASKRVRSDGVEHDIIFNKGRDYFLVSCKWVTPKVQWKFVSPLLSEAEAAGFYAGIMVSMSGFTINCLGHVKGRKTAQKILLFGPRDVESLFSRAEEIFSDKHKFSDLLDEKIQKLIHQNKILVDTITY